MKMGSLSVNVPAIRWRKRRKMMSPVPVEQVAEALAPVLQNSINTIHQLIPSIHTAVLIQEHPLQEKHIPFLIIP